MTEDAFASFLALSDQDRRDVFAAAANRLDTLQGYVEKDFWVCLVLDALFNRLPAGHAGGDDRTICALGAGFGAGVCDARGGQHCGGQAIANMRKCSMAGSVCTVRAGSRHSRMQPASVSASPSRRSAARSSTSPPSDEIDPPAKSAVTFLPLTAGRSNGRRVFSVMAAWRFSCLGGNPLANEFLPESNELRHVRHPVLRP